nr:glycosyltransferase family 39 protein [Corynebacterium lactis]
MTTGLQTPPTTPEPVTSSGQLRRPWDRIDTWIFAVITALTAVSRLVGLTSATDNGTPLFDEKHYVPQAWQLLESSRGPLSVGIEDNPGFGLIVHPPVAKQIIALGEWAFGYNALGWRITSALAGIAVVVLLMDIARRLTRGSRIAVIIAGAYGLADGVLFVSSRVGMLDMIQTLFIVGAVWALLIDQEDARRRLQTAALGVNSAGGAVPGAFGPYLGYRWWRLLAGGMLGLALGVKWSGLYYIAAFGLFSVFSDVVERKRAGATKPVLGGLVRDTAPALRDLVAAPLVVYFLSWRSWFAEETSVYRHISPDSRETDLARLPLFDKLPEAVQNYLHYQYSVLKFHAELTTSNGHHHPWESKPWHWLISYRPMLYYSTETTCSGGRECKGWIMLFGTPPIWWLLVPVVVWAAWRWLRHLDGRYAIVVIGFLASWLPWVISYDRQMYFFYATALIPFVLIGYALIAADLSTWQFQGRRVGLGIVIAHATLVIAAFIFWLPILTGIVLPVDNFNLRFWLPSWS